MRHARFDILTVITLLGLVGCAGAPTSTNPSPGGERPPGEMVRSEEERVTPAGESYHTET